GHSLSFEVGHRVETTERVVQWHTFPEFLHGPEHERLVVWALDEQLQLRMLIGNAQRCGRRLAVKHFAVATIELLAETFAPELLKPESELPQRLRVWKEDKDSFLTLAFKYELNKRANQCGVFEERFLRLQNGSLRAFHQFVDVESK